MSNLDLWNAVEKTPTVHTKAITGKSYSGTSPKPYYLVQKATETFGPCGIGWGFVILDERIEEGAGGERLSIARVRVWYKWKGERGEVEHIGGTQFSGTRASGKPFTDEDAPKKSVTDALVKALSMIGFAGDIFMGRYDDSKYVSGLKDEEREATKTATPKATPKPNAADLVNWKCPEGVNPDLWETAMARVQAGVEAYREFWTNDLTPDEKQSLMKHHGQLKAIAERKGVLAA